MPTDGEKNDEFCSAADFAAFTVAGLKSALPAGLDVPKTKKQELVDQLVSLQLYRRSDLGDLQKQFARRQGCSAGGSVVGKVAKLVAESL